MVDRAIVLVERQLSPTIVEFSATLTSSMHLDRKVTIDATAEPRADRAFVGKHETSETQPLLDEQPTFPWPSMPSLPTANISSILLRLLRRANIRLEGNLMIWLLFLRWYGLYTAIGLGCLLHGALITAPVFLCMGVVILLRIAYAISFTVYRETVTVIRQIGVQVRLQYFNGSEHTQFVDKDKLKAVFVHEYVSGSSVAYCLAFLLQDDAKLRLVFQHCYPSFQALRRVYQACSADSR